MGNSNSELVKLIEEQHKKMDYLNAKKLAIKQDLLKSADEMEDYKENITKKLDGMDAEFEVLERRNLAYIRLVDESYEKCQQALAYLDDRIETVQKDSAKLQLRNQEIVSKLNKGLKDVIKSNLK